jgi:hypothetical protein
MNRIVDISVVSERDGYGRTLTALAIARAVNEHMRTALVTPRNEDFADLITYSGHSPVYDSDDHQRLLIDGIDVVRKRDTVVNQALVTDGYVESANISVAVIDNSYRALKTQMQSGTRPHWIVCVCDDQHVLTREDVRNVFSDVVDDDGNSRVLFTPRDSTVNRAIDAGLLDTRLSQLQLVRSVQPIADHIASYVSV